MTSLDQETEYPLGEYRLTEAFQMWWPQMEELLSLPWSTIADLPTRPHQRRRQSEKSWRPFLRRFDQRNAAMLRLEDRYLRMDAILELAVGGRKAFPTRQDLTIAFGDTILSLLATRCQGLPILGEVYGYAGGSSYLRYPRSRSAH